MYLSEEFNILYQNALSKAGALLQQVVDSAKHMNPSESEQVILVRFSKFITRINQTEDSEEVPELLEELDELMNFGDYLDEDDEDGLIGKLLRQHNFEILEDDLEKEVNISLKRIEYTIQSFLRRQKHHHHRNTKWSDWFVDFKKETDIENKLGMLIDFVEDLDC